MPLQNPEAGSQMLSFVWCCRKCGLFLFSLVAICSKVWVEPGAWHVFLITNTDMSNPCKVAQDVYPVFASGCHNGCFDVCGTSVWIQEAQVPVEGAVTLYGTRNYKVISNEEAPSPPQSHWYQRRKKELTTLVLRFMLFWPYSLLGALFASHIYSG